MADICSMTGSGQAFSNSKDLKITLQLRSVNNRYFDFSLRCEDMTVQCMYTTLKEKLSKRVNRGKIECAVLVEHNQVQNLEVDLQYVKHLAKIEQDIGHYLSLQSNNLAQLLNCPGILITKNSDEKISELVMDTFEKALDLFVQSRIREGEKLKLALIKRLNSISAGLDIIKNKLHDLSKLERERLLKHLNSVCSDVKFDINRLEQEVVLMAERDDIQEEYDRLRSHVCEVFNILSSGGVCGKRLDFMMQEFNREANTMASKTSSLELTHLAVDFKVLIEQMREQVQNIE